MITSPAKSFEYNYAKKMGMNDDEISKFCKFSQ